MSSEPFLAFDADDTLWHNETFFALTEEAFAQLLAPYAEPGALRERLTRTERRNLGIFGYGVKGFTLSMIETAIDVTDGTVPAIVLQALLDLGKEMMAHPVTLLDGVGDVLEQLATRFPLMLITKGDLFHQENKVARSGLADLFTAVEIISEKDTLSYSRLLARHGVAPERLVMIGNSLRSDVLPILDIGGWGVHIPYSLTWAHEQAPEPLGHPRYVRLSDIRDVPMWVEAQFPSGSIVGEQPYGRSDTEGMPR